MNGKLYKHAESHKSLGQRQETSSKQTWLGIRIGADSSAWPVLMCGTATEQRFQSDSMAQSETHSQLCTFSTTTGASHSNPSTHLGPSVSWNTKASGNQAAAIILRGRTHIKMSGVAAVPKTRALKGALDFFYLHRCIQGMVKNIDRSKTL